MILLISCNNNKESNIKDEQVNLTVDGDIDHELLQKKISCQGQTYNFSLPYFNKSAEVNSVLNKDIIVLLTDELNPSNKGKDDQLTDVFDEFIKKQNSVLCNSKNKEGLLNLTTIFVSDTPNFTSYEIEYTGATEKGRLLKTFLKPELKEIHLSDIIPESKKDDVKTIFDINLQQAVANLVTEIPPGEMQNKFIEHVRSTAFQFDVKDFATCGLAFQFNSEISKNVRLSKKVKLPASFDFLNTTVVVEIDAYQLTHYLDLSRIID
jgi:hypothetical protein